MGSASGLQPEVPEGFRRTCEGLKLRTQTAMVVSRFQTDREGLKGAITTYLEFQTDLWRLKQTRVSNL